jgi:hypothetical protein
MSRSVKQNINMVKLNMVCGVYVKLNMFCGMYANLNMFYGVCTRARCRALRITRAFEYCIAR